MTFFIKHYPLLEHKWWVYGQDLFDPTARMVAADFTYQDAKGKMANLRGNRGIIPSRTDVRAECARVYPAYLGLLEIPN